MAKTKRKSISNNLFRPEFFKVFLPHHLTSQKLLIPPDYIKNFSRTLQERIALKDEEGNVWHVNVEKIQNEVFISGWQNFVNHKGLSVGDFLVFRYDGSYSFLVKTFGPNGCKKESSVGKANGIKVKVEQEEEEEDEELEKRSCKRARVGKEDCSTSSILETEISRGAYEYEETNVVPEQPEDWNYWIEAEPIPPKWAYFVSVCRKSCLYAVHIPSEIINREDVRIEKEMVLCNSTGKQWPVEVYTSKNDGRVYFSKGWNDFRKQNNLAFEDTCEFNFDIVTFTNRVYVNISHQK